MLVLALAAVLIASSFTAPNAEQAPSAKPQLRVTTLRPFAVLGTGFRPGETVRLDVRAEDGAGSAKDVAGRRGAIDASFPRLKLGRCSTYMVTARGNEGSRASIRSFPHTCGIDPRPTQ
jgi:hypothetical protein